MSKNVWKIVKPYKKPRTFRAKLTAIHPEDAYSENTHDYVGRVGTMRATTHCPGTKWIGGHFSGYAGKDASMHILFARFEKLKKTPS